jgi:hypothetical protein
MARRAYWATVQRAPGRTYDLRVTARGPQHVLMVREIAGASDQASDNRP